MAALKLKPGLPARGEQVSASRDAVLFKAARGADHSGVMVAVRVPPAAAARIALPGGEPPEDLHVTLAYLGDASGVTEAQLADLRGRLARVASTSPPLEGRVSGYGRFRNEDEDGGVDVLWAHLDSPGLAELRHAVVEACRDAGLEPAGDHGFTPHVTLDYVEPGAGDDRMPPDVPVRAAWLSLVAAGREWALRLRGAPGSPDALPALPPRTFSVLQEAGEGDFAELEDLERWAAGRGDLVVRAVPDAVPCVVVKKDAAVAVAVEGAPAGEPLLLGDLAAALGEVAHDLVCCGWLSAREPGGAWVAPERLAGVLAGELLAQPVFMPADLLALDGDLTTRPARERRELVRALFAPAGSHVVVPLQVLCPAGDELAAAVDECAAWRPSGGGPAPAAVTCVGADSGYAHGPSDDEARLVLAGAPARKVGWTDEAREAAAESRRRRAGGKAVPPEHAEAERAVRGAGMRVDGWQENVPGMEGFIAFTDPVTGTSLAMRPSQVTPESVAARVAEKRRLFADGEAAKGAMTTGGMGGGVLAPGQGTFAPPRRRRDAYLRVRRDAAQEGMGVVVQLVPPRPRPSRAVEKYITHSGDKWVVHAESGRVLGAHDSKADAERQLRAVEAGKRRKDAFAPGPGRGDGDSSGAPAFGAHTFVTGALRGGEWVEDPDHPRVNPYEALFLRSARLARGGDGSPARERGAGALYLSMDDLVEKAWTDEARAAALEARRRNAAAKPAEPQAAPRAGKQLTLGPGAGARKTKPRDLGFGKFWVSPEGDAYEAESDDNHFDLANEMLGGDDDEEASSARLRPAAESFRRLKGAGYIRGQISFLGEGDGEDVQMNLDVSPGADRRLAAELIRQHRPAEVNVDVSGSDRDADAIGSEPGGEAGRNFTGRGAWARAAAWLEGTEKRSLPVLKAGDAVAVDFDGTITAGAGAEEQEPMRGVVDDLLRRGARVVVFTARDPGEVSAWLSRHGWPDLEVTNVKSPDFRVMLDDRAVGFSPELLEGDLAGELAGFRAWWEKAAADWSESEHPRASDGRFGSVPGRHGGQPGGASAGTATAERKPAGGKPSRAVEALPLPRSDSSGFVNPDGTVRRADGAAEHATLMRQDETSAGMRASGHIRFWTRGKGWDAVGVEYGPRADRANVTAILDKVGSRRVSVDLGAGESYDFSSGFLAAEASRAEGGLRQGVLDMREDTRFKVVDNGSVVKVSEAAAPASGPSPGAAGSATPRALTLNPDDPASKKALAKERAAVHKLYGSDPGFRRAADVVAFYTQGEFKDVRERAEKMASDPEGLDRAVAEQREHSKKTRAEFEARVKKWEDEGSKPERYADGRVLETPHWVEWGRKFHSTDFGLGSMGEIRALNRDQLDTLSQRDFTEGVRSLQGLIAGAEPSTYPVYRGLRFENTYPPDAEGKTDFNRMLSGVDRIPSYKVGEVVSFVGPSSFTRDRAVAQDFADGVGGQRGRKERDRPPPGRLIIQVEPGARGVNVDVFSTWKQKEFLTQGKFEVVSVNDEDSMGDRWGDKQPTVQRRTRTVVLRQLEAYGPADYEHKPPLGSDKLSEETMRKPKEDRS